MEMETSPSLPAARGLAEDWTYPPFTFFTVQSFVPHSLGSDHQSTSVAALRMINEYSHFAVAMQVSPSENGRK